MLESKFLTRICQIAGVVLAITSVLLTAQFGLSISFGMMAALAVVSFMASYLPAVMVEVYESGRSWLVWPGLLVCALVTVIDVTTNASTTGVHKSSDVTQAHVQQTKYEDNRANVAELQNKLKFLEERQKQLEGHAGWSGAKPAAAYAGEIEATRLAMEQEAKRGGCGPKCLAIRQKLAELEANQAVAAEHEKNARMLSATVEALKKTRDQAATVARGESAVETQNLRLASLFTFSRSPSDDAQHWTDQILMVAIGLVITLASQFFNILGFVGPRSASALRGRLGMSPAPAAGPAAAPMVQRVVERVERAVPRTAFLWAA
jgi:hypothetical protein